MTAATILPAGFAARAPTLDDLQAVTDLIVAFDVAEYGTPDFSIEDLRGEWQKPRFELAADARLILAPDGLVVGYEEVWVRQDPARLEVDGYVHPQYEGRGLGTYLLRWAETRARERSASLPPGTRVEMRAGVSSRDQGGQRLFPAEGYEPIRHFWRMEIDLTEAPPTPVWPAGLEIRAFVPGRDEHATHAAVEEAFADHWGHLATSFEEWLLQTQREGFDPALWFLAWAGDRIAGASLCRYRTGEAWLSLLGVRRAWRHQGLGLALLLHTFGEFYRRGDRRVGLGVDAQNPTGATRLYQRAGMHVARQNILYAKALPTT